MQAENKVGIIIITYNNPHLIRMQVELIRKFCKDSHDILVVDNSTEQQAIDGIQHHATDLGCQNVKTSASSKNGSSSHSFAANFAYNKFKNNYPYLFFIDHDCFPVKLFSVIETMKGKVMGGIGQLKNEKTYMWPGCLMINNSEGVFNLDFSPNHTYGLDTGGNLYKIIEALGEGMFVHFNEKYEENAGFTKTTNNVYSMIFNETFMHFGKASNWDNQEHHEERINSLINVLIEKTK